MMVRGRGSPAAPPVLTDIMSCILVDNSYMRGVPKDIYPFSEGGCNNIRAVCCRPHRSPLRVWKDPTGPYQESQRFWWIENEYYSCF